MSEELRALIEPIKEDLTSGAAELALRAITVFQTILTSAGETSAEKLRQLLRQVALGLVEAQPAMAPIFHLSNRVLIEIEDAGSLSQINARLYKVFTSIDRQMCESAEKVAEHVFHLIPPGELVFAYSFSSTVASALLNARQKGKFFRAVTTESRPALEGRKLASMLAEGGLEVIHTFDSALSLVLSECRAAFMGCDAVSNPGVVNKVGSWTLGVACQELRVPLYALTGTEKLVTEERLFEFEDHERPGHEVWSDPPSAVRVLNHQFELVPFTLLAGLVTEDGLMSAVEVKDRVDRLIVHEALASRAEASSFA